jgi:hypothetical protein
LLDAAVREVGRRDDRNVRLAREVARHAVVPRTARTQP